MRKYKATGNLALFDEEDRQQRLSKIGNPLERLSKAVDFEMFREELEDAVLNKEKKSHAGAKPYDVVLMFKIMVIQRYYNLSDDQTEYQIEDRGQELYADSAYVGQEETTFAVMSRLCGSNCFKKRVKGRTCKETP